MEAENEIKNQGELGLNDLGYDDRFAAAQTKLGWGGFAAARVIAEYKELYRVKNQNNEYLAKITGKLLFAAVSREDYPAVGDWVAIDEINNEQAAIIGILPRKTVIKRKAGGKFGEQIIAANVDAAFITQALDNDYSLNRFERYFAIARAGGVEPAVILNKTDLVAKEELDQKIEQIKNRFGQVDIIATNTITDSGLDDLRKYIESGKTYCFLGSSGVGKSTLINKLIGKDSIKTGAISADTERGRHTTTAREMYFLKTGSPLAKSAFGEAGGIVIDNPGMREVGLADSGQGVDDAFAQITELAQNCKFGDCAHVNEPGCAVLAAVESGELDAAKYDNYIGLKKETEFYEMDKAEKREKDRQFGKFIKRAQDQLKRVGDG